MWKLLSQSQMQEELGVTAPVEKNKYYFCFCPPIYRILEAWIHQLSSTLSKLYVCLSFCWEGKRTQSDLNNLFKAMSWTGWPAKLKHWRFKFWQLQVSRSQGVLLPATSWVILYHPGSTTSGGQRLILHQCGLCLFSCTDHKHLSNRWRLMSTKTRSIYTLRECSYSFFSLFKKYLKNI